MGAVYRLSSILVTGLVLCGCAGGFRAGQPWDPNEEPFFDDGIDLVEDPSSISGTWAYEHEKNLDARIQLADLIAEVEIMSVQTISDMDEETARRIDVTVENLLYGKSPDRQKVSLFSSRESRGYELILRYERRLTGRFILFVRWFVDDKNNVVNHFHLSPASSQMKADVDKKVTFRQREESAMDRR